MITKKVNGGNLYIIGQTDLYPKVDGRIASVINDIHRRHKVIGLVAPANRTLPSIWDKFEHMRVGDDHIIRAWSGTGDIYVDAKGVLNMFSKLPGKPKPEKYLLSGFEDVFIGDFDLKGNDKAMSVFKMDIRDHQLFRRVHGTL